MKDAPYLRTFHWCGKMLVPGIGFLLLLLTLLSACTLQPTQGSPLSFLGSIHMVDANNGWGLTKTGVVRTTDGGVQWSDVTPHTSSVDFITGAFLDASTAVVFIATKADSTQTVLYSKELVFRTSNGGQSWQQSSVDYTTTTTQKACSNAENVSFFDAQHGWFMCNGAVGGYPAVLYRTVDGGATWQKVFDNTSGGAGICAVYVNGLNFRSDSTGFAVASDHPYNTNVPFLCVTHDGGKVWKQVTVPAASSSGNVDAAALTFFNSKDGVFAAGPANTGGADFFVTHDSGQTWLKTGSVNGDPLLTGFADEDHGWTVSNNGKTLYASSDATAHWAPVGSAFSVAAAQLDFISSTQGWVIEHDQNATTNFHLLTTTDGGQTWTDVAPTLV